MCLLSYLHAVVLNNTMQYSIWYGTLQAYQLPACLLHAPLLASTTSKQVFSSKVIDAAIV